MAWKVTNFLLSFISWDSWLFRNKNTSPAHPSGRGQGEKKLLNDPFIQFSIASLISSQETSLSKAHLSPWSRSMPPTTAQLVTVYAHQTPKHFASLSWWRISTGYVLQQPQQGNPSPTSFRAHSSLPILISRPLAKESPQFPLPPRAAAL